MLIALYSTYSKTFLFLIYSFLISKFSTCPLKSALNGTIRTRLIVPPLLFLNLGIPFVYWITQHLYLSLLVCLFFISTCIILHVYTMLYFYVSFILMYVLNLSPIIS